MVETQGGTRWRVSHTGQEPQTVPYARRLVLPMDILDSGYHPPFLELEPDRILRDRTSQGCTESNPDLCLSNTRVSCGSALSRETTSRPNIRVGSLLGWAVPVPRSQPREQSSHQMTCRTKIIRYKIKSDSWETLHKHRKIGNCIFQVSLRINQCV